MSTPFQGREVILSLVESSVDRLFYFLYSLKQQGSVMFSLWDRGQKKGTFCQVFRVEPAVQHHQRRARGGNKEVFIFCMKEFLSGPAPAAWSLSTDFKSFSGGAHVTCTGSQCGNKPVTRGNAGLRIFF